MCLTGVTDVYSDEQTLFERQIHEKTDTIDLPEQGLLCTNNRLQEVESNGRRKEEERELLSRQREAMRAKADPVEECMYWDFVSYSSSSVYNCQMLLWQIILFSAIIYIFYIQPWKILRKYTLKANY